MKGPIEEGNLPMLDTNVDLRGLAGQAMLALEDHSQTEARKRRRGKQPPSMDELVKTKAKAKTKAKPREKAKEKGKARGGKARQKKRCVDDDDDSADCGEACKSEGTSADQADGRAESRSGGEIVVAGQRDCIAEGAAVEEGGEVTAGDEENNDEEAGEETDQEGGKRKTPEEGEDDEKPPKARAKGKASPKAKAHDSQLGFQWEPQSLIPSSIASRDPVYDSFYINLLSGTYISFLSGTFFKHTWHADFGTYGSFRFEDAYMHIYKMCKYI